MTSVPSPTGDLRLGHILDAAGLDPTRIAVLRHTYTADGLIMGGLTPQAVLEYTRRQAINNKLGSDPAPLWVCFMADGKRRSRLVRVYENHGELLAERTDQLRCFDLRPSDTLAALVDRLVIEWSRDPVNWAKTGTQASAFPVLEIADPHAVPFPGFDRLLLTHDELVEVVESSRHEAWRAALGAVQGIYLIADISTGKLYVGKADGSERILGRWTTYAKDGHGANLAMKQLMDVDPGHRKHFRYSLLRVFGPSAPAAEVDQAESHFKKALLSRQHGLNRN